MTAEEKLLKSYEKARAELQKKMETAASGNMRNYYRQLIKDLDKTIKELKKSSADYAKAAVQSDYMQNAAEIFEQMTQQRQIMLPPEAFRQLHSDAIYDLRREMQTQLEQGLEKARQQTAQLIEDAADTARKIALRSISLDAAQYKVDTVGTISDMQQEVKRLIEKAGILKVEVGSGKHKREMSVTNYAHLVARSVSIEVGNTARINQLTANGYDLVEMSTHYPTCEICAILQDRVYSISGNDKRFPPLSKAIGEYKNIHPHCRHVIVGWVESMHTPEEVAEAIKRSNREWTDPRTGEEKELYNELQRKNRQARDLRSQYERYKEVLGSDAPKSIMALKKLKKADDDRFAKMQRDYTRRSKLKREPSLALPFADKAFAEEEKFTKYFFNPENPKGYSKGVAFSSHLGYNIKNWEDFRAEIIEKVALNPACFQEDTEYGQRFNVPMILYGAKNNPMDVIAVWEVRDGKPRLITIVPNSKEDRQWNTEN